VHAVWKEVKLLKLFTKTIAVYSDGRGKHKFNGCGEKNVGFSAVRALKLMS
jgi:hypothetical protein